MIAPTGKHKIIERASSTFEPRENAVTSRFEELELHRSSGFLLQDGRARTSPLLTISPILIFTISQPRSLLSIARSNIARSWSLCSRSSQNLIAQTCCGFNARLAPICRPAFHGRQSRPLGSNSESPTAILLLASRDFKDGPRCAAVRFQDDETCLAKTDAWLQRITLIGLSY